MDLTSTDVGEYGDSHDTVSDYDGVKPFKTSSAGFHTHTVTINNTGGNLAHENRMPYQAINRWKRVS